MFENLLSTSTQKQVLGISLTPGIGLEAVLYDRNRNTVLKYGRRQVDYNFSTREIQNYAQFKTALRDLASELNIAPKALAYLVLPNVHFDFVEVPASVVDSQIKEAILSTAQDFYLFKKEEPVSGWCEVPNINNPSQKKLAYTSFQKTVVDNIKDYFNDVNLQLIGIESTHTATVRGLHSAGFLNDVLSRHESWIAMIVNVNSFTLLFFNADNLESCIDIPIAIKSFSTEEAYSAIASNASERLFGFSASKLFIVSQTDEISADILKNQISYDKEIVAINTNKYSEKPVVEVSESADFKKANSLTLTAIGAANIKTELGLNINVLAEDSDRYMGVYMTAPIFGMLVDVTAELVQKFCYIIAGVCLAVFGIICLLLFLLSSSYETKANDTQSEVSNIENLINAEKQSGEQQEEKTEEVDMTQVIDEIAQTNVKAIKFYDSIASDMPKNIWLTKYYNLQGDRVVIQGVAENISDIYEYFKNLKIMSPESDIKLTELKVITGDNTELLRGLRINENKDRLYSFEISNTSIQYSNSSNQQENGGGENNSGYTNEGDIIVKPAPAPANSQNPVEETSEQLKPVP